jgi:arsenate reductase
MKSQEIFAITLGAAAIGGLFWAIVSSERPQDNGGAPVKRVLFVCVENSNRSQMAEAFARMHGGSRIEAFSAGSKPSGIVNPKAIDAMRERDYDLTTHRSKSVADFESMEFDAVVTMGCGDACPNVRAERRFDWQIPDPKQLPPDEFNAVRDSIERQVRELLAGL